MGTLIDISALTRDEKSVLLYAETVCVDFSGLLEGKRLNSADLTALAKFQAAGLLSFGRVPAKLLADLSQFGREPTHWVTFNDAAWELAHALRRQRALRISLSRAKVDALLAERVA